MLPSVSGMFSAVGRMLSLRQEAKTLRPHQKVPSPDIEGAEPQPATTQGTDNTILAKLTTSSAETNPPAAADIFPKNEVTVPVTEMDTGTPRDLMTPWAASPAMAENQIIPTTRSGDKPVSPIPSGQVGGERPCILTVTASIGRFNLEATGVPPSDIIIALVGRMTFGSPHMVASLPGLSKEGKEGSHQGTATDELAKRDLAKE